MGSTFNRRRTSHFSGGLTLFSIIDLNFILALSATAIAISVFQTGYLWNLKFENVTWLSIEIEKFIASNISSISLSEKVFLLGKTFAAWFLALLLPSLLFALATNFSLRSFTRSAQRLVALTLIAFYFFVSKTAYGLKVTSWLPEAAEGSGFSLQFYLALQSALLAIASFALVLSFIFFSERKSSRILRFASFVGIIAGWLFLDWNMARDAREVALENKQFGNVQTHVFVVPDFSEQDLKDLMLTQGMGPWTRNLRATARLISVSQFLTPEIVTLLSGKRPFEHGVRTNLPSSHAKAMLTRFFSTDDFVKTKKLRFDVVGKLSPIPLLLPNTEMTCAFTLENAVKLHTVEQLKTPFALLPESLLEIMFPERKCSQKYEPLDYFVSRDLVAAAKELKSPIQRLHLWELKPLTRETAVPEQERTHFLEIGAKVTSERMVETLALERVFQALSDHFTLIGIEENVRVVILGPSSVDETQGVFALFEGKNVPHLRLPFENILGIADIRNLFNESDAPHFEVSYAERLGKPLEILGRQNDALILKPPTENFHTIELTQRIESEAVFEAERQAYCYLEDEETGRTVLEKYEPVVIQNSSATLDSAQALEEQEPPGVCTKELEKVLQESITDDVSLSTINKLKL